MSKQKETRDEPEPEEKRPTDYEQHYAMHADPNRERWNSGLYDVASDQPDQPDEIGGGANAPTATGLDPASCAIGDPDMLLVVHGLNFRADTLIVFDGTPVLTNFVSETEINCELRPSAFTEARGYPVSAQQGQYVNPKATMFTVTEPAEADMFEAPTSPRSKRRK